MYIIINRITSIFFTFYKCEKLLSLACVVDSSIKRGLQISRVVKNDTGFTNSWFPKSLLSFAKFCSIINHDVFMVMAPILDVSLHINHLEKPITSCLVDNGRRSFLYAAPASKIHCHHRSVNPFVSISKLFFPPSFCRLIAFIALFQTSRSKWLLQELNPIWHEVHNYNVTVVKLKWFLNKQNRIENKRFFTECVIFEIHVIILLVAVTGFPLYLSIPLLAVVSVAYTALVSCIMHVKYLYLHCSCW